MRLASGALLAVLACACVPRQAPPLPAPTPPPRPLPPPVPEPPLPAPSPVDWMAAPLSPGDWRYRGEPGLPLATFASESMSVMVKCDRTGMMLIAVQGARGTALTLRTTYGERRLPATAHFNETLAHLPASDPIFDQMAFSRGRVFVQAEGARALIVPAWPEIARVTEDCRG